MSIHPDILELIHAEIDGLASEADLIRLRDAIRSDAAVREEYRRLRGLCEILSRVEPAAPPAQLAPSVMRAVRAHGTAVSGGLLGRFRAYWPGGGPVIRYAYAVAAGAVVGILGFHLVTGGNNYGPVVPEGDAGATLAPSRAGSRLDLTAAGVPGFATLKASPTGTAIGLDLSAKEPVEFLLRYDPARGDGRVDVLVVRNGEATEAGSLRLTQDR
jgi:anti-sigma factor RsiW